MEGDAADHAVFNILIVFEIILVEIKFFNVLSYLKLDSARAKRRRIVIFHQAAPPIIERPAGYRDLRHNLDLHIVFCQLGDLRGEILHLSVCRRRPIRFGGLLLHGVKIVRDGLIAGEAAGVVAADLIDTGLIFLEVDVDEVELPLLQVDLER